MPVRKLMEFLDRNGVKYVSIIHSPAYTAQEIAHCAHIPGDQMAKTVILRVDKSQLVMAVLPASRNVDLEAFREATGFDRVELASERSFADAFPGCEVGAMPPFGNLWDVPVYVSEELTHDERIAFNAGSHTELVELAYVDFARLVGPTVMPFSPVAI